MNQPFLIFGGTCLVPPANTDDNWIITDLILNGSVIGRLGVEDGPLQTGTSSPERTFDASGLLILPGIVDIHGDAFERQIQPRPRTLFAHDIALADTDRQLAANGITTACHGVTYSWEGGLRGRAAALALMAAVDAQRLQAQVDHRIHLRFENHHIDGLADVLAWIAAGRIDFLTFNEHLPGIAAKSAAIDKMAAYAERARCDLAAFMQRLQQAQARGAEVEQIIEKIAAACRAHGIPMASHDDMTHTERERYADLGVAVSEFPRTEDALFAAVALDNPVIMGAPNVLLGGSHCGGLATAAAVASGMCDILASDYYYPSMLHAPFALAQAGVCCLAEAWRLVSVHPAQALGLTDRGLIATGQRADLLLVQAPAGNAAGAAPRLIATIAAGRLAYCVEPERLSLRQLAATAA